MARRPLDAGGIATPDGGGGNQDFVLPPDLGASEVERAIEDWLRGLRVSSRRRDNDAGPSLQMTSDGRAVVPAELLLLLGDGFADCGKQVMEEIVKELRNHRILDRLPVRSLLPARR